MYKFTVLHRSLTFFTSLKLIDMFLFIRDKFLSVTFVGNIHEKFGITALH